MLDTDTKRRIDTARDILVGKVPDPKSQVEQITIALIYKFMDDMDAEAAELGGDRQFFTGDFAEYGWARLMSPSVSGHDLIDLYGKGISTMPQNPGIPVLFRDIFKNAYLPYRDPETLKSFLKIINEFSYDHSERLGDAFEYLLSVLGSQGDAGQFRTPRHIIDFMVEIMRPQKGEVILDPACGTAGFLISAYKYILRNNQDVNNISTLTPDEKGRLAQSFKGYDISPDMVRLSLVNLYLHGFANPSIAEYDTLTSEDRWNEFADLILANPPFMSPKGGIKPHKRFSIKAKRSEVLFVDYIAEHLTPTGRAGIIVPEGIIFQSQTAYKELRKALLKDSLVAVISLPAGVFNPYSGVKTSILILDKVLAKKSNTIAFFKVENDGFGLGAQRREIEQNDLPSVLESFRNYELGIKNGDDVLSEEFGASNPSVLVVPKEKIAANGDFSFSGERYREIGVSSSEYSHVELRKICEINPETANPSELYPNSFFNYIDISCVENESGKFLGANKVNVDEAPSRARRLVKQNDVLLSTVRPNLKAFTILSEVPDRAITSTGFAVLRSKTEQLMSGFLIVMLRHQNAINQMIGMMGKGAYPSINQSDVESIKIPLPPIAIQQEIVAEIEGYQKVIDGARAVIDNYRPHIPIDPDWPILKLGELFETKSGTTPSRSNSEYFDNGTISWVKTLDLTDGAITKTQEKITQLALDKTHLSILPIGTVLIAMYGGFNQIGRTGVLEIEATHNQAMTALLPTSKVNPYFLNTILVASKDYWKKVANSTRKDPNITKSDVLQFKLPVPSLEIQKAIVAEIEAEQSLVDANRELITRFEKKIQTTLNRIWGAE